MIGALKIKCTGAGQPAKELSGGNQQKVVFAKALLTEPSIWICDEPTQAVDVATRQEIHRLLRKEAEKGKLFSTSHRISRSFWRSPTRLPPWHMGKSGRHLKIKT